jgi:hypothetical protein
MTTTPTSHLHYGGSYAPATNTKIGSRPGKGTSFKKNKMIETLIRLENAQFTAAAIAAMAGISVNRFMWYKRQPDYLAARIKITHGIIVDHEGALAQIASQRREMLTQLLPPALQHLANTLQEPALTIADKKHKTAVALEVMDREGTFAKVSRTEVKPVDKFDFEQTDAASRGVIQAIKNHAQPSTQQGLIEDVIATSGLFAKGTTLSVEAQQQALTDLEQNTSLTVDALAAMPVETREQ